MKVENSKLGNQIIQHVKDNPFCSRDSIFTKGGLPKSNVTLKILNELESDKVIHIITTRNGRKIFHIPTKEQSIESMQKETRYDFENMQFLLRQLRKKFPEIKTILEKYEKLLDIRKRITDFENKYANNYEKEQNHTQIQEVINHLISFIDKKSTNNDVILDAEHKYLDREIFRDEFYWDYNVKGVISTHNYPQNQRECISSVRTCRSVWDKINIIKDRHKFGISRPNTIYHKNSIMSKKCDGKYHFNGYDRLDAERNRTLFYNPPETENEILITVCNQRLEDIAPYCHDSKGYQNETKMLEKTINQLKENPTMLHDLNN